MHIIITSLFTQLYSTFELDAGLYMLLTSTSAPPGRSSNIFKIRVLEVSLLLGPLRASFTGANQSLQLKTWYRIWPTENSAFHLTSIQISQVSSPVMTRDESRHTRIHLVLSNAARRGYTRLMPTVLLLGPVEEQRKRMWLTFHSAGILYSLALYSPVLTELEIRFLPGGVSSI